MAISPSSAADRMVQDEDQLLDSHVQFQLRQQSDGLMDLQAEEEAPAIAASEGDDGQSLPQGSASSPSLNYSPVYTLIGHTRSVSALSFSPDGNFLASASADKTVRIWSLRTGNLIETLRGHAAGISDLAWSPCGRYLATASDDKTVGIWNAASGYDLRHLIGHTSYVFCVAYSPQSNLVVSGSFDETVRLWDVRKGTCHRTIAAHSEAVTDVDFNRDGTLIASCSYDGLIRLWDVPTGLCLATLPHPTSSPTTSIRFSPSSSHLLASSLDSTIRLWDVANGKIVKTYRSQPLTTPTSHSKTTTTTTTTSTIGSEDPTDIEIGMTTTMGMKNHYYRNSKYAIKSHFLIVPPLPSASSGSPTSMGKQRVYIISGSEDHRVYFWDLQTRRSVEVGMGLGGGSGERISKGESATATAASTGGGGGGIHRDVVGALSVHPKRNILASAGLQHDPSIRIWFDPSSPS